MNNFIAVLYNCLNCLSVYTVRKDLFTEIYRLIDRYRELVLGSRVYMYLNNCCMLLVGVDLVDNAQ